MTKLKKLGMPVHSAEAAEEWRRRRIVPRGRPAASRPAAPPTPADLSGDELLNVGQERARLLREQRREVERRNAVADRQYAPLQEMTFFMAAASSIFAERMDFLPSRLRREHPNLPADVIDTILSTLAEARNATVEAIREGIEKLMQGAPLVSDGAEVTEESDT